MHSLVLACQKGKRSGEQAFGANCRCTGHQESSDRQTSNKWENALPSIAANGDKCSSKQANACSMQPLGCWTLCQLEHAQLTSMSNATVCLIKLELVMQCNHPQHPRLDLNICSVSTTEAALHQSKPEQRISHHTLMTINTTAGNLRSCGGTAAWLHQCGQPEDWQKN